MTVKEEITGKKTQTGEGMADADNKTRTADDLTDTTNEPETDDNMSGLPVDRGWAWVILAGAIFEMFIYGGLLKSYGIFFVEYQKHFRSSASETAVMMTIQNIVISISGIFSMSIGMKYMTARTSICIGGIITFVTHIASAFAEDIRVLNFTIGVVAGASATLIFLPILATIGIYFNKRRGLANSLTTSGVSLGGLVFGPIYTTLFDNYGYWGTMLIASAILLNILVTGMLMRPPEFWARKNKHSSDTSISSGTLGKLDNSLEFKNGKSHTNESLPRNKYADDAVTTDDVEIIDENNDVTFAEQNTLLQVFSNSPLSHEENGKVIPHLKHSALVRTISHDPIISKGIESTSPLLLRARANTSSQAPAVRKRTLSDVNHENGVTGIINSISRSKIALYANADGILGSMPNIYLKEKHNELTKPDDIDNCEDKNNQASNMNCCAVLKIKTLDFLRTVFDVKLLKNPVFIHFICLASMCMPGSMLTNVFMIPLGKDLGITNQQGGIMLSIVGCVDLVSRICVGFIADKKWLKPTTLLATAALIMAIMNNITRLLTGYWSLLIFVIIQGSLSGVYNAIYAVILVDTIGMEKFKASLGFSSMCHGCANGIFFQLTGLLRDITGAYFWTYHLISGLQLVGCILAITLPLTQRWTKAKNETKNDK